MVGHKIGVLTEFVRRKLRLDIGNRDEAAEANVETQHHGERSTYTIGKSFSNLSSETAARPAAASA